MSANNLAELEKEIRAEINKAMIKASKKVKEDMKESLDDYYDSSAMLVKRYKRTNAMRNSPRVSDILINGDTYSFTAYLDTSHQYTTGDNPTMMKVLRLANYGQRWRTASGRLSKPTVGDQGFWERAETNMEQSFYNVFTDTFG